MKFLTISVMLRTALLYGSLRLFACHGDLGIRRNYRVFGFCALNHKSRASIGLSALLTCLEVLIATGLSCKVSWRKWWNLFLDFSFSSFRVGYTSVRRTLLI